MIKIKTDTLYQKIALKFLKKKVKDWAFDNLDKVAVYNSHFLHNIEFNRKGIKHTIFAKTYTTKQEQINRDLLISVFHLRDLLLSAKFEGKGFIKPKNPCIKAVYVFSNKFFVDSRKYVIRIIVREVSIHAKQKNKLFFYDHSLKKL